MAQFDTSLQFLESQDESQLKDILLSGFLEDNFPQIVFTNNIDIVQQFQILFEMMSATGKERFKRGTIWALAEWSFGAYGQKVLIELAYLSAYIRATGVIPYLRIIINDGVLRERLPDSEFFDKTGRLISVLAGFVPDVHAIFEGWFYDDSFDLRFAGQLFLSLCESEPERWVEYIQRFMDIYKNDRECFEIDFIFKRFKKIVTKRTIERHLYSLDKHVELIVSLLGKEELMLILIENRRSSGGRAADDQINNSATIVRLQEWGVSAETIEMIESFEMIRSYDWLTPETIKRDKWLRFLADFLESRNFSWIDIFIKMLQLIESQDNIEDSGRFRFMELAEPLLSQYPDYGS